MYCWCTTSVLLVLLVLLALLVLLVLLVLPVLLVQLVTTSTTSYHHGLAEPRCDADAFAEVWPEAEALRQPPFLSLAGTQGRKHGK